MHRGADVGPTRSMETPSGRNSMPSASSAATTRSSALALALGTPPLEPSQAVRQGREIEARSASSCCETPVRRALRATGNLDNRHVEIVCAASAQVNVSVLYQFVDTAKRPWPTNVAPRRVSFGRAARGSVAPGRMACRPTAGERISLRFKAINSRTEGGSLVAAPF